jgi:hypothetical protein
MFKRILTYSILTLIALGGFFGNIVTQKDSNTNSVVSMSYETSATYAADPCPPTWKDATGKPCQVSSSEQLKMWNTLIDSLNVILGIITAIVSPAIMFAGWLMSPDWTSGDLFGLRENMYKLWVTVSNIVYFIYAILLILIALGTMFGQDKFSYKVMLPKLALGILMVPFTWWFVQWTISISSVVTASVISIPMETIWKDSNWWMGKKSIPSQITIDEATSNDEASSSTKWEKNTIWCASEGANCLTPTDFLRTSGWMYGYMMVYAYSVFKFDEVKKLPTGVDILKTGLGIAHQGILAAIMFLVFGLLTLALVAMLLVRAIKLWIYAIFSPMFTFRFVAGSNMLGWSDDTFSIKEFVGLCFVPAIVGLTLSFGLILINAVSSSEPLSQKKCTDLKTWCELVSIMGSAENKITRKIEGEWDKAITINEVKFGGITMTFKWKAWSGKDVGAVAASANAATGVLNSAGGIFGTLIIDIIALVFIWMAFMAAKNVSKAVSAAVQPFEDIGKKVGNLAQSIPKYTPIPGLGMSANSMGKIPQWLESALEAKSTKDFKNSGAGRWLESLNPGASANQQTLSRIQQAWNTTNSSNALDQYKEWFTNAKNEWQWKAIYTDPNMITELRKLQERVINWSIDTNDIKAKYGREIGDELIALLKNKDWFDQNKERIAALLAGWTTTDAKTKDLAIKFLEKAIVSSKKDDTPLATTIEIIDWWGKFTIPVADKSEPDKIIEIIKKRITPWKEDDIVRILNGLKGKIDDSTIKDVEIGLRKLK